MLQRFIRSACWTLVSCCCTAALAQSPAPLPLPHLDLRDFGTGTAALRTGDGGAIIAGGFRFLGDQEHASMGKLLPSGSIDAGWQVSVTGIVDDMALSGDRLFLAGRFTAVNGVARQGLAEVSLASGALASFDPNLGSSTSYSFSALAVHPSGLFIGGQFTQVGATAQVNFAKIDLVTNALVPGFAPQMNSSITELMVSGDRLYIGGYFTQFAGAARQRAARIDANTGALHAWAPDFSSAVTELVADGGKIYAAGCFLDFLARVDPETGARDNWSVNLTHGCVTSLDVTATHVYFSGPFTQIDGHPIERLARIDKVTAAIDTGFDPNLLGGNFATVGMELAPDRVLAVGEFVGAGGGYSPGATLLDRTTGALATQWPIYAEHRGEVHALAPAPEGGTFVGGRFTRVLGEVPPVRRQGVFRLDSSGGLVPGFAPNADGVVHALAATATDLFIGGTFRRVSDIQMVSLARLSVGGVVDSTFAAHPRGSSTPNVNAIVVDEANQTIRVGGSFNSVGPSGTTRLNLAEFDFSGNVTPWIVSADGEVRTLLKTCDGLYVGGEFSVIAGAERAFIAKLQPGASTQLQSAFTANTDSGVHTIQRGPLDRLYLGGRFQSVNGAPAPYFARVNAVTGQFQGSFDPALNGPVRSMAWSRDGLMIAGAFDSVAGLSRHNLFRLMLDGGINAIDPEFAPLVPDAANAVLEQGERVLVGGSMNTLAPLTTTQVGLFAFPLMHMRLYADGFEGNGCD